MSFTWALHSYGEMMIWEQFQKTSQSPRDRLDNSQVQEMLMHAFAMIGRVPQAVRDGLSSEECLERYGLIPLETARMGIAQAHLRLSRDLPMIGLQPVE